LHQHDDQLGNGGGAGEPSAHHDRRAGRRRAPHRARLWLRGGEVVNASVHRPLGAAQLLLRMATIVVLVFLIAPIVVVFPLSFSSGGVLALPTPGYSWSGVRGLVSR